MRDIYDYLSRLGVAVLLCPVATGAWFVFALSGFSFDGVMVYLGSLSLNYATMGPDAQAAFRFQVYATWGVMAFSYLFLTFVISPPRFRYRLSHGHGHVHTDVVDSSS